VHRELAEDAAALGYQRQTGFDDGMGRQPDQLATG
jgi:hypothetical protein